MLDLSRFYSACHNSANDNKNKTKGNENHCVQRCNDTKSRNNRTYKIQYSRHTKQLSDQYRTKIRILGALGNENTCGQRNQQGRDLADQTVTNSQNRIFIQSIIQFHSLTGYTHGNTAYDINGSNNKTGSSISFNVLNRTIHGTEEAGFFLNLISSLLSLGIRNSSGI